MQAYFLCRKGVTSAVMRAISISALCIHITNMDFLAAFIDICKQKCS